MPGYRQLLNEKSKNFNLVLCVSCHTSANSIIIYLFGRVPYSLFAPASCRPQRLFVLTFAGKLLVFLLFASLYERQMFVAGSAADRKRMFLR